MNNRSEYSANLELQPLQSAPSWTRPSWTRPSTCTRAARRTDVRTWIAAGVALVGALVLITFGV
jgi:hypothetical protein